MPRVEELYAYIAHDNDDPEDEGVTAFKLEGIWLPMVGADEARMKSLKGQAQMIANTTGHKITLVRFSTKTVLETIEPE